MLNKKNLKVNPYVFFPSAIISVIFVIIGVLFTKEVGDFFNCLQNYITTNFGWFYIIAVTFFLFFIIWLLFSKYGNIRLGRDDEEPEYSLFTWFAMLFSAGMGIGLLFYGVAEPVLLFEHPPGHEVHPGSVKAVAEAMRYTFFHWGLHAWGIYIVIGLSLAYFSYRQKLPLNVRSTLYPILGEKIYGFWGNLVETLAVLGTIFGLATSLGLGVMQVNSGLNHLNLLSNTTTHQVILIIIITSVAIMSLVSGVDVGIRRLSELNLCLALILLLFVFIAGPTVFLLRAFSQNVGYYLQTFMETTFQTDIFLGNKFQKTWTLFYWGWWIAWSPFVGMFIARVSRGRTIREFIAGVLLVPTILTFIWMTVFGDTALHMEIFGDGGMVAAVRADISTALFVMLEKLPYQSVSCFLAVCVVAFFFITSSDSASLVVDILTSGGQKNPPVWQKIFWGSFEGVIAIILLVTGGLVALQTAVITTALPFCIIMIFICYSLWKALKTETEIKKAGLHSEEQGVLMSQNSIAVSGGLVDTPISETFHMDKQDVFSNIMMKEQISDAMVSDEDVKDWKRRLNRLKKKNHSEYVNNIIDNSPAKNAEEISKKLQEFIAGIVKPAFIEIEEELIKYGRDVKINISYHQASIIVKKNNNEELYYAIRGKIYHKFSYTFPTFNPKDVKLDCYAQVVLRSGTGKVHELKKFTRKSIIHDFLNEYEKWAILN